MSSTRTVPLYYDFWGFPERFYQVEYPAPRSTRTRGRGRELLGDQGQQVERDEERGLDHGASVPLAAMYPEADVPVWQTSMPTLDPAELYEIGRRLAPLRRQGVLIVGSGFSNLNLREMDWHAGLRAIHRPGRSSSTTGWANRSPPRTWMR